MITQLIVNNTHEEEMQGVPGEVLPDGAAVIERLEAFKASGVTMQRISVESEIALHVLVELVDLDVRNESGFNSRNGFGSTNQWGHETKDTKLLRKLSAWLDGEEAKRDKERVARIATPTRSMIESVALRALREKRLVSLSGSYGIGKSKTLEWFAGDHPMTRGTPGAVYVVFTKDDRSAGAVYRKIASAMGLVGRLFTRDFAAAPVRDALRSGDVLLCDNVNYLLETGTINVLADIYDTTPASIVAAGNDVYANAMKRASDDADAFFSRAIPVPLEKSTEGDVDAVLLARGLAGAALRSHAVSIAVRSGREGGLRALLKVIDHASERAAQVGRPIDAKSFRKAATELMLTLPEKNRN